jgi:hypothetical protein
LVTFYVLFFLDLASRTVKIAGATTNSGDAWMTQIARNLTDPEEGFLRRTPQDIHVIRRCVLIYAPRRIFVPGLPQAHQALLRASLLLKDQIKA